MSTREFIPVVGLIGGVGSGKSAVAHWIGNHKNVLVIDGDSIGHQVLKSPETKNEIRDCFSNVVFNKQGDIDRKILGRLVFGSTAEHGQAKADLEQIVHPTIRKEINNQIRDARLSGDYEAIILDAAVLLEAGWNDLCDAIVFVEVSEDCRRKRVVQNRGWDDQTFKTRESSQLSLDEKRKAADEIIDNSESLNASGVQLEKFIEQIINEHV